MGGSNDWDLNDWVINVYVETLEVYSEACGGWGVVSMKIYLEAVGRGGARLHEQKIEIPADTFGEDGSYHLLRNDSNGIEVEDTTVPFTASSDLMITVFPDTWTALPPNGFRLFKGVPFTSNTEDTSGVQQGEISIIEFTFAEPFVFNLDEETPYWCQEDCYDADNNPGAPLFFNPILTVKPNHHEPIFGHSFTPYDIEMLGDIRSILVPVDMPWPEERVEIWNVYPDGVSSGNPPVFDIAWWATTPTGLVWNP